MNLQFVGFLLGCGLIAIAVIGAIRHLIKVRMVRVEPIYIVALGLLIALGGVVWQWRQLSARDEALHPSLSADDSKLLADMRSLVTDHIDETGSALIGIFSAMNNIDMGASAGSAFFVMESVRNGVGAKFNSLEEIIKLPEGKIDILTFKNEILGFFRSYKVAQDYLPKFVEITNVDPNRVGVVTKWLDADRRCLSALREMKARPYATSFAKTIPDDLLATANGFDGEHLSALVVARKLPVPTEKGRELAEKKKPKSGVVLEITKIDFDPNGPTEMYVDFILRNPGQQTTINNWNLSVYEGTSLMATELSPRFILGGKLSKDSFGVIRQENLKQQPVEQGETRDCRLGFTFFKMIAQDLFGKKGLRFSITAGDVYGKQLEASFTRN